MNQKKIFIPTISAEDWKDLLADPEKHWRDGYSAKSIAQSWEAQNSIPNEIKLAFSAEEKFSNLELLLAIPEFKVSLPGGNRPSQNDVFFLAGNSNGLLSCTVEAKALEDFDKTIKKWYRGPSDGKQNRLDFILKQINFPPEFDKDNLRYQLFHRLASAVIMAKKFHAKFAFMIIQSFTENDDKNHYSDFKDFIGAYRAQSEKEKPIWLTEVDNIEVYAMWVYSKAPQ
jgi:hypothetical protein